MPNRDVQEIKITEGSKLYGIYKKSVIGVNSFHHQTVKMLGKGFVASGILDDGVTEAIERKGERFAVGIQWHPEMMDDSEEQQKKF